MTKQLFGYEFDNSETGIIFRTTERPKYLIHSFPSVVTRTSEKAQIYVLNNCRDKGIKRENQNIIWDYADYRVIYFPYDHLLGVPGSINEGVRRIINHNPKIKRVFVVDDDCIAPSPKKYIYWDEVLSVMLEAGWKIAGHPNRVVWYTPESKKTIGNIEGHVHGHLSGSYAGFKIDSWVKVGGVPSSHPLYGFGPFCHLFRGEIGYWAGEPQFTVEDIDRDTNPKSLRKSEYFKWYRHVRPAQARKIESEVPNEFQ